jgi:hypothetical protein
MEIVSPRDDCLKSYRRKKGGDMRTHLFEQMLRECYLLRDTVVNNNRHEKKLFLCVFYIKGWAQKKRGVLKEE